MSKFWFLFFWFVLELELERQIQEIANEQIIYYFATMQSLCKAVVWSHGTCLTKNKNTCITFDSILFFVFGFLKLLICFQRTILEATSQRNGMQRKAQQRSLKVRPPSPSAPQPKLYTLSTYQCNSDQNKSRTDGQNQKPYEVLITSK